MKMLKNMAAAVVASLLSLVAFAPAHADDLRIRVTAATINVASLADAAGETDNVTVPGASLGDACIASAGVTLAGITVTCYVSAADTASIRVQNESGGTLDLASTTFRVYLFPKGTN
jgi:ribosomal protein L18E